MIVAGRIAGPRGLDGTVKIETDLSADELRGAGVRLHLGRIEGGRGIAERPVAVEAVSRWRTGLAARFSGVGSREEAEGLTGKILLAEGLEAGGGGILFGSLRGMGVRSRSGEDLGVVTDLLSTGGHDLLIVRRGGSEWYLPMVAAMVLSIDRDAGIVTVDLPEGLLDVNP